MRGRKRRSQWVQRNCLVCGAEFTAKLQPARANRPGHGTCCSKPCQQTNMVRRKIAKQRATFAERFWARVDQSGGPGACWPWTGTKTKLGYGEVSLGNINWSAPRTAIELTSGPTNPSLIICHHCDNPPCCNPAHLYVGTPKQNSEDQQARGKLTLEERIKRRAA